MQLTREMTACYVGGQLEVQNEREDYPYRGEIATIEVTEDHTALEVTLNWNAKGEGYPALGHWVNDTVLTYTASLPIYTVVDIADDGRLSLQSLIVGETAVLYLPGRGTLDPSKVAGLNLS